MWNSTKMIARVTYQRGKGLPFLLFEAHVPAAEGLGLGATL